MMLKIRYALLPFVLSLLAGCQTAPPSSNPTPQAALPAVKPALEYRTYSLPGATLHSVWIPSGSGYRIVPALSKGLATVEQIAQEQGAIAAINGGFFDPENQQSTSYITRQGKLIADPHRNDRLMNNSNLAPYLNQIFNRSEFRRYQCGQTIQYGIALYRDAVPSGCQRVDALGAGPRLLPDLTALSEGFVAQSNGVTIRDALSSTAPNARSAVGITPDGAIVLVMAAQKPDTPNSGVTLPALASFLKTLHVSQAINLDGGSSASLFFQGRSIYGKMDDRGHIVQRPIKSALLVLP
jgi:uncharacterized protein YigE (DUF2233 family)